jgi:C-terminal processing protease CtpA/Prc
MKDCHLGTLVGEETGGLGSGFGQFEAFTLPHSKLTLWVSVKHIFRPSMVDDGRGILPDLEIVASPKDAVRGIDSELEGALKLAARK